MTTPPRVFISYSPEDKDITAQVATDLRATGLQVWIDAERDMASTQSAGMAQCEWFVLILTPHSLRSPLVQREMNAALDMARQGRFQEVLLLLAAPVNPEELPSAWQQSAGSIDATHDYPGALRQLVQTIRARNVQASPGRASTFAPSPSSRQNRQRGASGAASNLVAKLIFFPLFFTVISFIGGVALFNSGMAPWVTWQIALLTGVIVGLFFALLPGHGGLYLIQLIFFPALAGLFGFGVATVIHGQEAIGLIIGVVIGLILAVLGVRSERRSGTLR